MDLQIFMQLEKIISGFHRHDHVSEYKDGVWKKYFIGENYFVQSISGIGSSVYLTAYPIGVGFFIFFEI